YLRDCLETLVVVAYERGFLENPPRLADPVASFKELSCDSEACNWKIPLDNGKRVDAIAEVLEGFYLPGIEEMIGEGETTKDDVMGFNLIEATLNVLGERRLEYLLDGLDWVTKKMLIEEYAPNDPEDALGICNQYALIDPSVLGYIGGTVDPDEVQTTYDLERSLEFAKDAIPLVEWDTLSDRIAEALRHGPEGTREYLRCLVAREFPFLVESIEWERITFPGFTINLMEPFIYNREMCGDLLEESTVNLDAFRRAISRLDQEVYPFTHKPTEDHERLEDGDRGGANP
ncbi:MAG: proteasome accessory factor PafA2 family protein, partial [Candidatus Bathyarchaeia archaeon]